MLCPACAREEVQIVIPDSDPESRRSPDAGLRREDGLSFRREDGIAGESAARRFVEKDDGGAVVVILEAAVLEQAFERDSWNAALLHAGDGVLREVFHGASLRVDDDSSG